MDRTETDFPQGDGHIDCPDCKGRGVLVIPKEELPPHALPGTTRFCGCVHRRDLMDNLKRGWKPISKVPSAPNSPLLGKQRSNVWLRSPLPDLKQHIRAAACKMAPRWRFKVITDTDLMTTWLYSANEVYDADVNQARTRAENNSSRITDLVEPWELLIIRLGVKAARNNATAEVFLEALLHRQQIDRPTWVVDSSSWPLRDGHLAWDVRVQEFLDDFEFIEIGGIEAPPVVGTAQPQVFGIEDEAPAPAEQSDSPVMDEDGRMKTVKRDWK